MKKKLMILGIALLLISLCAAPTTIACRHPPRCVCPEPICDCPTPEQTIINTYSSSSVGGSISAERLWLNWIGMENRLTVDGELTYKQYPHLLAWLDERYLGEINELRAEIAEMKGE